MTSAVPAPAAVSTRERAEQVWDAYWRGPGSPEGSGHLELRLFPVACVVAAQTHEPTLQKVANYVLHSIANCIRTEHVLRRSEGRIVETCTRWQASGKWTERQLVELVDALEELARDKINDQRCVSETVDLVLPKLTEPTPNAGLIARVQRVQAMSAPLVGAGVTPAKGRSTDPAAGDVALGAKRPYDEGQRMWMRTLDDLDSEQELAHARALRSAGYRKGSSEAASPDEPSALRREALDMLARGQASKAIANLERALEILERAFGPEDSQTKATREELARAKGGASAQLLPVLREGFRVRPKYVQRTLATLQRYYQAVTRGYPIPPVAYAAACKALSDDPYFEREQWSDPLVSGPFLDAARTSLQTIPASAAALHVNALLAEAHVVGLGPAPRYASTCPEALLSMAQELLERTGLPVDPRIGAQRDQLLTDRAAVLARQVPIETLQPSPP